MTFTELKVFTIPVFHFLKDNLKKNSVFFIWVNFKQKREFLRLTSFIQHNFLKSHSGCVCNNSPSIFIAE